MAYPLVIGDLPLESTDPAVHEALAIPGILLLFGLGVLVVGGRYYRRGRLVKNTPPEQIRSIALGRTEIHGQTRASDTVFTEPFGDRLCVYRDWSVKERQKKKKRTRDDDGNMKTEETYEWVTVQSGTDVAPFFVEDDTGHVLVDADHTTDYYVSSENSTKITVRKRKGLPGKVQRWYNNSSPSAEEIAELADDDLILGDALENHVSEADRKHLLADRLPDRYLDDDGGVRDGVTETELRQAMAEGPEGGAGGGTTAVVDRDDPITSLLVEWDEDESESSSAGVESADGEDSQASDDGESLAGVPLSHREHTGFIGRLKTRFAKWRHARSRSPSTLRTPNSKWKRRFTAEVIPVDEEVYVFGGAEERRDASGSNAERLRMTNDPDTGLFMVSDRSEDALASRFTRRGPLIMLAGLALSAAGIYLAASSPVFA